MTNCNIDKLGLLFQEQGEGDLQPVTMGASKNSKEEMSRLEANVDEVKSLPELLKVFQFVLELATILYYTTFWGEEGAVP